MRITFSIIIPVYNVEKYLNQCVKSVLMQTYTDYEVLLIDDGSTDGSAWICDELVKNNKQIKVIHQKNQGLSAARNTGIDCANGEYLIFLDSDDYWDDRTALQEISKIIDEKKPEVVTWSLKKYIEDLDRIESKNNQFSLEDINDKIKLVQEMLKNSLFRACAWDKAVKRSLVLANSLYFKVGDTSEDIEWVAKLLVHISEIAFYTNDFYVYRQRSGSITKTKSQKNINDLMRHIENCVQYGKTIKDEELEKVYWGYVSEQYANMLIVFAMENSIQENVIKEENNKWLLKYGCSIRTKLCYRVSKVIGIRGTILLLKVFLKLK